MPIIEAEQTYFRMTLPNLLYGFSNEQLVMPPVVPPVMTPVATPVMTPVMMRVDRMLSDRQKMILRALTKGDLSCSEIVSSVDDVAAHDLRRRYLRYLLDVGYVEYTLPDKPNSRFQKYRLSADGKRQLAALQAQLEGRGAETINPHETIKSQPKTTEVTSDVATEVKLQDNAAMPNNGIAMPNNGDSMPNNNATMPNNGSTMPNLDETGHDKQLWEIVQGLKHRAVAGEIEDVVCKLCAVCPLRRDQIARYVNRSDKYVRLLLNRLVKAHRIRMTIPEMPKHPAQAYIANEEV